MLTDDLLITSPDKSEVFIKIQPQKSEVKPTGIRQLLGQNGLSKLFLVEDNILKAADLINLATRGVALAVEQKSGQGQESELLIAQRKDAKLEIEFSDDEMKAYAVITAPYGGETIAVSDLITILSQHNLTQSLHNEGLDQFIETANAATPGERTSFHVISGTPPIAGEDSKFEYLVDTIEQRSLKPQQSKHGKVNMHELGEILTVKAGSLLIRRHPPTDGTPGTTVLGETIAPTPGQLHDFVIGDGTEISSSDQNLLIASRTGIPRTIVGGLAIDDVLVVDNVDVGFGNIRFEGSVMISGDVCEGLKVVSEGSITVAGAVNSATLEAKGNITVNNGIVGKKGHSTEDGYSCKIKAGGSVNTKFIQYSEISASQDVIAQTHILHSKVVTNASVIVATPAGNKGTLFGGSVVAGQKISAVEIGGNSGSRTLLTIKGQLAQLRIKNVALNKSLQQEHDLLKQLLTAHEKVGHLNKDNKKQQLLQQLKQNVDKKSKVVVAIQAEKAINEKAINSFLAQAAIHSIRSLQHGVQLEIDGKKIVTKQAYKATETRINRGKLLITPITR